VEVGILNKVGKIVLVFPFNKIIIKHQLERMVNGVKSAVFANNSVK
jgi:hypothetical protein